MARRQQSAEHLFEAASALKTPERSAFLDEACNGDCELRHMVETMLHPLPQRSFVALLNLPMAYTMQITPVLIGEISAIKSELSQLNGFDQSLQMIASEDGSADIGS